jgi:GDP-L-fucose synthase
MLGSALVRRLAEEDCRLLPLGRETLDLRDQAAVFAWFNEYRPDVVFVAAATVGGIYANDRQPADFLYDNLAIAANVIEAAHRSEVRKLVFFGTSCMYPKLAAQPIIENSLLEGPLEPTNEWYGVAKIAGVKLCQAYRRQYGCDFITVVPTNLYGPGDNLDPLQSHVIPALISKLHEAVKEGRETVEVWGTGKPLREFMHVDDAADAAVFLLRRWSVSRSMSVPARISGSPSWLRPSPESSASRAASRSTCQSPTARPGRRSTLPSCSRSDGARRSVSIREFARPTDGSARKTEPVARSSEPDRQKTRATCNNTSRQSASSTHFRVS